MHSVKLALISKWRAFAIPRMFLQYNSNLFEVDEFAFACGHNNNLVGDLTGVEEKATTKKFTDGS